MSTPTPATHNNPPVTPQADDQAERELAAAQEQQNQTRSTADAADRLAGALGESREPKYSRITPEMASAVGEHALDQLAYFSGDQTEDANEKSWEVAHEQFTQKVNQTPEGRFGKLKKITRNVWYETFKTHYILKYKRDAMAKIEESQDIHVHSNDEDLSGKARVATLTRFTQLWEGSEENLIHKDAGEAREAHTQESDFTKGIKSLVERYVTGELNDKSLQEEQKAFYAGYRQRSDTEGTATSGTVRIDNMLQVAKAAAAQVNEMIEIAKAVKGSEEHAQSVAYVLDKMDVLTGETRTGVRTGVSHGRLEEKIDKWSQKAGGFVGPETITIAASLALGVAKMSFTKALTLTGAIGAGAGVLGYLRERKRVNDDNWQHSREMAMGQEFEKNSKRREQMEQTRYETVKATDIIESINESFEREKLDDGGREALEAAVAALVAAESRKQLSDQRNIDLIAYSSKTEVELERFNMDLTIAKAKVELRKRLASGGGELLGRQGVTVEELLSSETDAYNDYVESIEQDIDAKDEALKKIRHRRALKAGAAAAATSLVIAGGVHFAEVGIGLVDSGFGTTHHEASNNFAKQAVGQHGEIQISDDHSVVQHDGKIDIVDHDGKPVDGLTNIQADANGKLPDDALKNLRDHGMTVQDISHKEIVQTDKTTTSSIQEFMRQPNNGTTQVTRDFWYDNNTPRIFEGNEQGLHLGGVNGNGITDNGTYEYKLALTQGNSFHGNQEAQLRDLIVNNKLKVAISADAGSQHQVFMVDAKIVTDASGKPSLVADIDPKSAAGSLYTNENGRMVFHGAYAELVEVSGTDQNGPTHIRPLATHVGDGSANSITHTEPSVTIDHPTYKITTDGYEAPNETRVPVMTPITTRKSLENARPQPREDDKIPLDTPPVPDVPSKGYAGRTQESLRSWLRQNPERLKARREVTGPDGKKVWIEADGSVVERSVQRERDILSRYIKNEVEKYPKHAEMVKRVSNALGPMGKSTRVSVNIPAWMEEKNLEHLLIEWTHQIDKDGGELDPSVYEIAILVNRKTGAPSDASVAVIDAFIENFEKSHGFKPNVRYADIELDDGLNNVGYARRVLADAVVMRSVERQEQDGPLYIESEDADMISIDKKSILNLMTKLDDRPYLDAVRGVQDRSPEHMMQNDMLFLQQRAGNFREIIARSKQFRDPSNSRWNYTWNRVVTGGWNTAFTAEAYGLIEGYDPVSMGEDMSIGEKISMIRGDGSNPNLEVIGTVSSRSNSSPRRYIYELLTKRHAYSNAFTDEDVNKSIRDVPLDDALEKINKYARINDQNVASFQNWLNWSVKDFDNWLPNSAESERMKKRLLFSLGLKSGDYKLTREGGVMVTSWDGVKQSLETYRTRAGAQNPGYPVASTPVPVSTPAPAKAATPKVVSVHEAGKGLVKIGDGLQYTVFDMGGDRVRKVPKTPEGTTLTLRTWFKGTDEEAAQKVERLHTEREEANQYVGELAKQDLEKVRLFGNPKFNSDGTFEQDRVTPLGQVLDAASTGEEKKEIIKSFVDSIKESWKLGCYEKGFFLTENYGKSSSGDVVLADFGEMGFDLEQGKKVIAQKPWKHTSFMGLDPELQAYYYGLMDDAITPEVMEENWRSSL